MSRTKSLSEVMEARFERFKSNLFTSLPAQVTDVSKYGSEQLVAVKPTVAIPLSDGKFVDIPILEDVPLIMPSAGGGLLSFPVAVGDIVLLSFSMLSLEAWKNGDGSTVEPLNTRYHSLPDAIAIAGLYTKSTHLEPNTESVELKFSGCSIKQNPDGTTEIYSPSDISVTTDANLTATVAGDTTLTTTNLDVTASGNITAIATGNIEATAISAKVTAPTITLIGAVTVQGSLTVIGPTALTAGVTVTGTSTMNGGSLNVNGGSILNNSVDVGDGHVHSLNNINVPDTGPPT